MKRLIVWVALAVAPCVLLGAQQAGSSLVSSRGMTASVQYPESWKYVLTDASGAFMFMASSAAMSQDDPFSTPDFNQMVQSRQPFVLAVLLDEKNAGQVDWLKPFLDLAEGSADMQGTDILKSESSQVCDLPGKLLVFNEQDTKLRGYLVAGRSPEGQVAAFIAFCPITAAEDFMDVFAAMHASFMRAQPREDMSGYTLVESGSLSVHKPDTWTALHVESPLAEVAMLAKGGVDLLSFRAMDSEQIRAIYPMAMIMRGPRDAVFGGDVQSAQDAVEQMISNLGSTDSLLSRSSVEVNGMPGERVVAIATLDPSSVKLKVGLYVVISLTPDGEALAFLGFAPQEGFAEAQREFEEISASLRFQPPHN